MPKIIRNGIEYINVFADGEGGYDDTAIRARIEAVENVLGQKVDVKEGYGLISDSDLAKLASIKVNEDGTISVDISDLTQNSDDTVVFSAGSSVF